MVNMRPDYRAMHNVATMMSTTETCGSAERRIYLMPFLMQVYWPEPMIELYVAVKRATISETLCKNWWLEQQQQIEEDYANVKYFDGMLKQVPIGSVPGRQPYKNPSERWPFYQYRMLAEHAEEWNDMAKRLAELWPQHSQVRLADLCPILDELEWLTVGYGRIRLCRCLFIAAQLQFVDDEPDWKLWRNMSTEVTPKFQSWACYSYKSAIVVRDIMRDLTHDEGYCFSDLICFCCLSW